MSLPHKVWNDCQQCLHQDNCDEIAMSFSLLSQRKVPVFNDTNEDEVLIMEDDTRNDYKSKSKILQLYISYIYLFLEKNCF